MTMDEEGLTTADLLASWRDASRAAVPRERLAEIAAEAVRQSDETATASERIATMAERAARSAERAADTARKAATQARLLATRNREERLVAADQAVARTRDVETEARDRYHEAESAARKRHDEPTG